MTLLNSKIYDCLAACINLFFFYFMRMKVFQGHASFSEKKGNPPKCLTRDNFPPRCSCLFAL